MKWRINALKDVFIFSGGIIVVIYNIIELTRHKKQDKFCR